MLEFPIFLCEYEIGKKKEKYISRIWILNCANKMCQRSTDQDRILFW